jgi:hypothetical protein
MAGDGERSCCQGDAEVRGRVGLRLNRINLAEAADGER